YERHMVTAIRKFYLLVFNKEVKLRRLSRNYTTRITSPTHIEKHSIKRMINSSPNLKHKCIIGLLYSAGMRVEELVNIKNLDIDFIHQLICITNPNTKKQRSLPLSPFLIPYLKSYRRSYSNERPVFLGYKNSALCSR